jgi:hypothetical protein
VASRSRRESPSSAPRRGLFRNLILPCSAFLAIAGALYGTLVVPSALGGDRDRMLRSHGSLNVSDGEAFSVGAVTRGGAAGVAVSFAPKSARVAPAMAFDSARFDAVVRDVALTPDAMTAAFRDAGMKIAMVEAKPVALAAAAPIAAARPAAKSARTKTAPASDLPNSVQQRMQQGSAAPADPADVAPLVLAYAASEQNRAARALDVFSARTDAALAPARGETDGVGLVLPDFAMTPDDGPLPDFRPSAALKPLVVEPVEPAEAAPERAAKPARAARQQVAMVRPDNPEAKPGILDRFFNRPKAGRGVAVYDISAARVYMPDGTVLEAHSGIGHMADNPKYAHVKMKGPTPPHTYNLQMREKRFHGVEAIRMLPVDGKNKHGRDGFLTHSYLLRGGRAESHGCVAFKDYEKFLTAFKKGKVKQMVVVPGGGKRVFLAKNGRGA